MDPQETIRAIAESVKSAVAPHLGTWRARKVTGIAASGDATFDIDDIAEEAVERFISDNGLNVAYYSEDRGLVQPDSGSTPDGILIIDPIDGTRGAIAGFEACVVSVAWTAFTADPTISDVLHAAIVEIKGGLTFTASRGEGIRIADAAGAAITPFLSPTTELDTMACTFGVVGAPTGALFSAVGEIADRCTVSGGFFILNSSAYELTRLVVGQLAGVVDVRNRLLKDFPVTRRRFHRSGGDDRLLSLYGYDVAAAALIATEAGCVLTDAWGRGLGDWKLLDTTEPNFGSLIAAANPQLHARLLASINAGFASFTPLAL